MPELTKSWQRFLTGATALLLVLGFFGTSLDETSAQQIVASSAPTTTVEPVPSTNVATPVVAPAVAGIQVAAAPAPTVPVVQIAPLQDNQSLQAALKICPPTENIRRKLPPQPLQMPAIFFGKGKIPNPLGLVEPSAAVTQAAFFAPASKDLYPVAEAIWKAKELVAEYWPGTPESVQLQWNAYCWLTWHESRFDPRGVEPDSGACGIPQALPCIKLQDISIEGQLRWQLGYHIKQAFPNRFTDPISAQAFWISKAHPCADDPTDWCGGWY